MILARNDRKEKALPVHDINLEVLRISVNLYCNVWLIIDHQDFCKNRKQCFPLPRTTI